MDLNSNQMTTNSNQNKMTTKLPMKIVKVHPIKSINFTKSASFWCEMTNLYKKYYPDHSFERMAKHLGLSQTNARRYYYGVHHFNGGYEGSPERGYRGYTQVRKGACVAI